MIRVEHRAIIQAPVEQVFSQAADYRKWPEWCEGVADVETATDLEKSSPERLLVEPRRTAEDYFPSRVISQSVGKRSLFHTPRNAPSAIGRAPARRNTVSPTIRTHSSLW